LRASRPRYGGDVRRRRRIGNHPLHERPEGRRLLEEAKEDKFVAALVYRLDRLGRALLVVVDAHDRL
jgi:DNA invertase Pin-like site-specific DNA recombinase